MSLSKTMSIDIFCAPLLLNSMIIYLVVRRAVDVAIAI